VPPLVFVWPYAVVFWAVFLWAFLPEQRIVRRASSSPEARGAQDAGSLRLIVVGQWLALVVAFASPRIAPAFSFRSHGRVVAFWTGVAMMVAGSLLRRHCFRVLGEWFTGAVTARAGQPVVTAGAYRWVRHPSYTAGATMLLGIAVALANWLAIATVATAIALVYGYRVVVEERALAESLGEPYRAYMRRTRRFIPFLF